jgi:hypothetical protein
MRYNEIKYMKHAVSGYHRQFSLNNNYNSSVNKTIAHKCYREDCLPGTLGKFGEEACAEGVRGPLGIHSHPQSPGQQES